MAKWRWALAGCATRSYGGRQLAHATGRSLTIRLDAASSATFTLDARTDEAAEIVPLATDLIVTRDGVKLFRGRIAPANGNLDATKHTVQWTAIDYRALLQRRITGTSGASYKATAAGAIAWDVVATSEALSGGALGITAGEGTSSGTTRDLTVLPGKPVMETINELGHLDGGFEWEIDPDLALNLYHSGMGADNGVVARYGGLISAVNYTLNPDDFANAVVVTGNQTTIPVAAADAGIGTDVRGRWELSQGFPTIEVQATLDDRGPFVLAQTSTLRPTYRVTLRKDTPTEQRWRGPSHIWKGDTVALDVHDGWLDVTEEPHRVVEIGVAVDDNGGEEVQFGLLAA